MAIIVGVGWLKTAVLKTAVDSGKTYFTVGYWLVTVVVGIRALSGDDFYSLIFLAEQIGLLATGFSLKQSWLTRNSLLMSLLAVLYFVREIPYLAFAILGLSLIGFVFYRNTRQAKDKSRLEK